MSEMRVFELAKEMKMPAKQLLQKIRQAGIPVSGNFEELTTEQVALIKNQGKMSTGDGAAQDTSRPARRVISARKKAVRAEEVEKEVKAEASQIVTIKTKTQLEEDTDRPRRRVRRKKDELVEENIQVESDPIESVESQPEVVESAKVESTETKTVEKTVAPEKTPVEVEPEIKKTSELTKVGTQENKTTEKTPSPVIEKQKQPETETKPTTDANKAKPEVAKKEQSSTADKKAKKPKSPLNQEKPKEHDDLPLKTKGYRKPDKDKIRGGGHQDFMNRGDSESQQRKRERPRDRKKRGREKISVPAAPKHVFNPRKKSIRIGNQVGVGELAGLIGIKVPEILKKLMALGTMATINQTIPGETAELVAADFDVTVEVEAFELEDALKEEEELEGELLIRAPIVTIMGHVDHGKTSLLDKIRETEVAEGEAGGITQHIGAYHLEAGGNPITFLDTPGHEAFTAMRARGADITDIVVLVVAADDKVQPQTIEAIQHARAAEVPIIVAVNKIDRPESNPMKIKQELLIHELIPEELGGSTIFVNVSAKSGEGIDVLLEMLHLQAEVLELRSSAEGKARGTIIESRVRKGQGSVGTVLVQKGTLRIGDYFVMGKTHGRIRAMFNERGGELTEAGPSIPVEISGLSDVPEVGEQFVVLEDERVARQIAGERSLRQREETIRQHQKTSLDNLFSKMEEGKATELRIIVKGDVQGSVEALRSSMTQLGDERISLRFLLCAVGNITETDVTLASASDAIIVGFNVQMDSKAKEAKSREGVDVRLYEVIYHALDDIKAAMEGLLEPDIREEIIGHCEIRQVFSEGKNGMVFGGLVTDGKILRNCLTRILRKGDVVYEGNLISLKRFKDDVPEVAQNYECGMVMDYPGIEEGDVLEAYEKIEESAKL